MKQYVVDAFAEKIFEGNPAAVIILENDWLEDKLMLNIAKENNLSETAYAYKVSEGLYRLRWFTPGGEIELCGHATLATAFTIMNFYDRELSEISFDTLSGILKVVKKDDKFEMSLPAYDLKKLEVTDLMEEAIGYRPIEAYIGDHLLCVFEKEDVIRGMKPDMDKVRALEGIMLQVTAKGEGEYDCVSRAFGPKLNVNEDPVCGSGHCHIIPYWSSKSKQKEFKAYQASDRGGELYCKIDGDRVYIAGKAVLFSEDNINI